MKNIIIKILSVIAACVLFLCAFASCGQISQNPSGGQSGQTGGGQTGGGQSGGQTAEKEDSEKTDIPADLTDGTDTLSVSVFSGTPNCFKKENGTLTFSGLTEDTICSVSGEFCGEIIIDAGEVYKFEIELCGAKIYSGEQNPITVLSGDKVTVTAKKGTKNYIYDTRPAVSPDDTASVSSAVYSSCDLQLGGKGELVVVSENNNGIHSKKDLEVKNLTLSVACEDNALKGNDGVTVCSGALTLVSRSGDGIKTTDSDASSKGNRRGNVIISGGTLNVYAACDGIDASYNVEILPVATLNVYTDRYSPYSKNVEKTESVRYVRYTSNAYSYSVKYYNGEDFVWANASYYKTINAGRNAYYYYSFEKIDGYDSFELYIYSSGQAQGQSDEYAAKSDLVSWNDSYDTFALESRGGSMRYNWTNYSSTVNGGPGGQGGFGGMADGNSEKGDHSTKGIKEDNEVIISGGTIAVNSYDDAIHANGAVVLESGETSAGNVDISGGKLTLFSKDDGIHADGTLNVSGGEISVIGSYEGLEGEYIVIGGGDISIVSDDDGINATATSGTGIGFNGGKICIYAGGDGIDSNSRTAYRGIVFSGADIVVIGTSAGNSSIDTEQGYAFTGGSVLAVCPSGGMGNESLNCQNFASVGTKKNISLSKGQSLSVEYNGKVLSSAVMPCDISALVIYLGASGASITAA